ncbi:hypothetical protein [Chitinibacter tainanensis]|uniref:hypothetical protein n=1 Tax=Chitinibacter tainanensis TaxID=230667 RepID=UPI0003FE2116|nr:hypothetical protein [Chitinibacter tainanensis]
MKRFSLILCGVSLGIASALGGCSTQAASPSSQQVAANGPKLIIQLRSTPSDASAAQAALAALAQRLQLSWQFERELGGGFWVVQLPQPLSQDALKAQLARIGADPAVQSAEADQLLQTQPAP